MISEVECCDNMEYMAKFPDEFFDLIILDPEYGIGASNPTDKTGLVKQKNGSSILVKSVAHSKKIWDENIASLDYIEEAKRISKNQIIWGGNYYGLSGGYLVWDKLNGECDQFGCELAWTSFSKRTDVIYYLWSGMIQGEIASKDIRKALRQIGNKKLNEVRIHPTQKPVKLYRYLLCEYAKPGYKIGDFNLGSQSSRIAADIEGFDFWGCEDDRDYFDDGCNRYDNHKLQATLF